MISRSENWLDTLSAEAKQFVKERAVVTSYQPGDEISAGGVESTGVRQLLSGYAKLIRSSPTGEDSVLVVFGPGNTWGESPILAERLTRHGCIAMTDCEVLCLSRPAFLQLYREFAEVPDRLCRRFARAMSQRIVTHVVPPSEKLGIALARTLYNCVADLPKDDGANSCDIDFPLTQIDLASYLGVTRQSIHREISDLRKAGIVETSKGRWTIRDMARLRRLGHRGEPGEA